MSAHNINIEELLKELGPETREFVGIASTNIGFDFDETVKEKNAEDFAHYYEEEFEKGVKPEKIITSFLDNYFSDEEEKNAFLKGVKDIYIEGDKAIKFLKTLLVLMKECEKK